MIFNFFNQWKPSIPSKPLKEFSGKELLDLLENNQKEDLIVLAGVCSEILRRMEMNPEDLDIKED